jgi:hypothetical protein
MARHCQAPRCGRELPAGRRRFCSDLCRIRGQRSERRYEPTDFGKAAIRMIRALAARYGGAEAGVVALLWEVRQAADEATCRAIDDALEQGHSYATLSAQVGVRRQSLWEWHHRRRGVRKNLTPQEQREAQ